MLPLFNANAAGQSWAIVSRMFTTSTVFEGGDTS
jgi:hypothetical protein